MPRKIVTLKIFRQLGAALVSVNESTPKAIGRDGITVESPIFCNFDALAQRLPQPHNRHRNPGLGP